MSINDKKDIEFDGIPLVLTQSPMFMFPQRNYIRLSDIFNIHGKIRKYHGKILSLILIGCFDRLTKKLVDDDKLSMLYYTYGSLLYYWNWFYETSLVNKLIEKIEYNKKSDDTCDTWSGSLLRPSHIDHYDNSLLESLDSKFIFHIIIDTIIPNFSFREIKMSKEDYTRNTRKLVYIKHHGDVRTSGIALCPKCKTDIHGKGYIDRCFSCGQKLKWKRG